MSVMRRLSLPLSIAVILPLVLAACSTPPPSGKTGTAQSGNSQPAAATKQQAATSAGGSSAGKIVLGTSAAFTGPSRGLGIELYRGMMAYIQQVNGSGGLNGKQLEVRAYDDGYDPTPAIEKTIKLVEEDDVFLLTGYVGTPTVTRVLPLLKRFSDRNVYLFFPFTGAQPQREAPYDDFVFNLRASYRQETEGLVDNLVAIGRKRIAVFYQADAYGRSGWDGVKRALAKHGLKIAAEATYRRGTTYSQSLKEQVDILRRADADAVISIGAYAACAAFIRDARDSGWDVPIANVSFVGSESLLDLLAASGRTERKDYATNLINSQVVPSYEDTSLPAVSDYRKLMDKYNPVPPGELMREDYQPLKYSFVSFEGYLNAVVLGEVLKRTGNGSGRADIKRSVESIQNLDVGLDAPVSFGPQKHQGLDKVYYTTVADGRFVPIKDWRQWAR